MRNILLIAALVLLPGIASAQEVYEEVQGSWHAQVEEITQLRNEIVPGTDLRVDVQTLRVKILDGDREGDVIEFENDYIQLKEGQKFYLNYLITIDGTELYSVREIDRRGSIMFLVALFAAAIIGFGGLQGVRSLASLVASLLVIVFGLVPLLVAGYPPVLTSILIAVPVLFFAIFFTHGFNFRSLSAFSGTVIAVAATGILASIAVALAALTGFSADESVYLNLNTDGALDFKGLLLASIIIGALGVLDDIAITQVAVVRELLAAGQEKWSAFRSAMRVGREHVGALVNTLVFAYTGAALPLLLLFSFSQSSYGSIINMEVFATEIIRALVGSIGLILTVPVTTLIAVFVLSKYPDKGESHHHHHA